MIGNRHSGDSIASEFMKIMGHGHSPEGSPGSVEGLEKSAEADNSYLQDAAADMLEDADADSGPSAAEGSMENAIDTVENMLTEDGGYYEYESSADDASSLAGDWEASHRRDHEGDHRGRPEEGEDAEDQLDSYLNDEVVVSASDEYLIKGLGKIAKGLRGKHESFAADMVEATARSIYKDIQKESSYKHDVVNNLLKISKELSSSGDSFASDLVKVTVGKIRKG